MSAFVAHDLTINGLRMIADAASGKLIEYTRIALGDGYMHQAQTPQTMTGLVNEVLTLQPSKIKSNGDGTVTVSAYFTNTALLVGFFYREIGLFAKHPDTGEEQLYCYGNAADFAEWIPPSGSSTTVEKIVDIVTVIGTAVAVTANINMALGATLRDIDDHNGDPDSHPYLLEALANKANKTLVQWYTLPISSGVTSHVDANAHYRKENNIVFVEGWVYGAIAGSTFAVLPEGFRPIQSINKVTPAGTSELGTFNAVRINVKPNGEILFHGAVVQSLFDTYGASIDFSFSVAP